MDSNSHIHKLANPNFFTPYIIVNDQGDLENTHLVRWCYEKMCGAFGYSDMCSKKLIGLSFIRELCDLSEKQEFTSENISDIAKIAVRAGLKEESVSEPEKANETYLLFNFPQMLAKERKENITKTLKNILVKECKDNQTILNCYPEKIKNIFNDVVRENPVHKRENQVPKFVELSEDLEYTSASSDEETIIFSEEEDNELRKN